MPPTKHSRFGASSATRWITCPGSVALSANMPKEETSFFASEGTYAHALAETCLRQRKLPHEFLGQTLQEEGDIFEVTEEMADAVAVYIREVLKTASRMYNPRIRDSWMIETQFSLRWMGFQELFGTCDACVPDTANRKLHIYDFKYGAGVPVYAENNWQLMYYALGVLGMYGSKKEDFPFDVAVLHIVQPRCAEAGVTSWEVSIDDLLAFGKNKIAPAVQDALSDNPTFCPTVDACRWCKAKGACAAYADMFSVAVKHDIRTSKTLNLPEPAMLSEEQVANVLELMPQIKAFFDAVSNYALGRAKEGFPVPGYKLVRGRAGNRKWADEKAVEQAFIETLGEDLYEKKILSPAQLEKKLGKDMKKTVDAYTVREEGKICLVPESDKREAINLDLQQSIEDLLGEQEL